jgi:RNA polymerase sigma factor (sigma-70 family)
VSTAQDLPVAFGEPLSAPAPLYGEAAPALRLVPEVPLDFDESVRRIRPRLHRYAVRRLGDLHEAEELVQEALLRAYSHREQLLTEDDLAAWTTVVTGRLVIDRLRVRGRSLSVADVPETGRLGRDTADVVVARDEARLALDALDSMHPRQAALLWAREVEGHSYDELCTRFSMTEPAVRSVLTRARKALRKEYSARGGTLPVGGLAVLAPWVAGLGWADRLRRVASRLTAPAALSAVGITALGGLVLSPFGLLPGHGDGTFRPAHAVVTTVDEPRLHGLQTVGVTTATVAPQTSTQVSRTLTSDLHQGLKQAGHVIGTCINESDDGQSGKSTNIGPIQAGPGPTAGSADCGSAKTVKGTTVTLTPQLPDNPTGIRQLGVTSDYVSCPQLPSTPAYTCTSAPSTQEH